MADHTYAAASPLRTAGSPGLHGRACKACATAKARCVPGTNSSLKCQRCQRLGKSCEQTATSQRRRPDKKSSRVAKLEEKLDSLVTLLNNASNKPPIEGSVEQSAAIPTPQSISSLSSSLDTGPNLVSHDTHPIGDINSLDMTTVQSSSPAEPSYAQTVFQQVDEQSFERGNILLNRFRTMSVYFPFVVIPPNIDAKVLSKEKPFLYKTIMAVAEQNQYDQRAQVRDIMQYLALHMLQLGEKSLDMFLGILVHIAWCHYHFHAIPRLTNLLHESLALLFDLGLNKGPSRNPRALVVEERSAKCFLMHPATERTLEERRAALGCFYLVSGSASYFQNIQPLKWSPYLEESLEELQNAKEYETDQSLIKYVKMQRTLEKINSGPWNDGTDQSSGWKLYPPTLYIKALQGDLQTLKNELDTDFPNDLTLVVHYYSVEMTLYEIGLSKTSFPKTTQESDLRRLEILYSCLESVRNFFENFLKIPPLSYWDFSLVDFSQLAYALNVLQRLSLFEDHTWDLQYVAEKVSFLNILHQICDRMEEPLRSRGIDLSNTSENISIFGRAATKLRKLAEKFEAQMASLQSAPSHMGNVDTGEMSPEDMMNLENMADFWEQNWFDIGGNWSGS